MTEPAMSIAEVWAGVLSLGYEKTRLDRAEKGNLAIEVGYGSWTIRLRMYNNREFVDRWDISTLAYAGVPDGKESLAKILAEIQRLEGEQA